MSALNGTTPYGLTPVQENVIAAITGGATMQAAAAAASIHRNTIAYWRRTSPSFCEALGHAQYDKALFIREEAESQVAGAFAAIHTILTKPDASDTARLNAAKFIIEKASTPPPPKLEVLYEFKSFQPEIVHSNAQSQPPDPTPVLPSEPSKPEIVHSNAQKAPTEFVFSPSTPPETARSAPKIGRNEPCPCGSHLKFKRCCLGKVHVSAAA